MVDKIYSKDHNENIRIFQDIDHKKKFSLYSLELNRVFGDKSYEIFYKNLIEHKRAMGGNFLSLFQKPKNTKGLRIYEEPFNSAAFEESLNHMKIKTEKLNYKIKNPYKSRPTNTSITKIKTQNLLNNIKYKKLGKKMKGPHSNINKENIYLPEVPDVGRYNPSYDVLRKHPYQVSFCNSSFNDFNKNGVTISGRNIFKGISETDYAYDFSDLKQSYIDTTPIKKKSNISIIINRNSNLNESQSKSKRKDHLYLSTSPFYNSRIIHKRRIKNSTLDNSKINADSQILIRNNGDVHSRCPKHSNNLNNSNSSFSLDDSKNNTKVLNTSNNSGNYSKNNNTSISLKNNHCLKFDNYSKRRPMINPLSHTSEQFTNPEAFNKNYPVRNKNACVEFNRISTSKQKQKCYFEVEANKNKNPPLGLYRPRYTNTFNKLTTNIYLDKKETPMTNDRRLKEIIYSYYVPSNYLLFDSLNKNDKSEI